MNYIENNLRKDEKVIAQAKIRFLPVIAYLLKLSPLLILGIIFLCINSSDKNYEPFDSAAHLIGVIWIILYLLAGLIYFLIIKHTCLALTNKRLIGKTGLFSIQSTDVLIEKIDNVTISAGFFGKLFHFYTVKIESTSTAIGIYKNIYNGPEFKNAVIDAIDNRAEELRKAQAAELAAAMNKNN